MQARNSNAGQPGRHRPAAAPLLAASLCLTLAACFGGPEATRSANSPAVLASSGDSAAHLNAKGEVVSATLDQLSARRSVLPDGSAYAAVARAVLDRAQASSEAELRVKRLSAEARSKNWLPKLGPDVSLSSLSSIAASLVMDQALFDRGKRAAERDFAAADVEVAAITLVGDLNKKVSEGLQLYIEAQRARELAQITEKAMAQMAEFERITRIRVEGGLSDGSEYRLIAQRLAEIEASLSSYREGEISAWAELESLTERPVQSLSGLSAVPADAGAPLPLSVLMAQTAAARLTAEVTIARSGLLPGLGAGASLGRDGDLAGGLSLEGDILGFGRAESLQALAQSEEAARRRIEEARRASARQILALNRDIAALDARAQLDGEVIAQTEANLALFTEQYKAGRRSVIELSGQFETLTSLKRDHASLKYQIAGARLEIALLRGVLVDGVAM